MQTAINFNNKACSLIDIDCFEEAMDSLSQALASVKNQLGEILEESPENPSKLAKTNCTTDCAKECSNENNLSTSSKRRKELEGLETYMYYHALCVHQIPSDHGHRLLSSVIIFNFALCHHLMALRAMGQKSKRENLVAALHLYKHAMTIQMEGSVHVETGTCATHLLAMVNNSAHIYELLDRSNKAQQFRNQMLSSLMIMIENGEAHTLDGFEGFLQSASKTILRETVTAAAA